MSQAEQFNEAQHRRLVAGASYIDKLLIDIDEILSASDSGGFPKYRNPLTPVQVRVVRDYIKRLRQQIVRVLADLDIDLPPARFDSTHSIRVTLQFVEIALEEIVPQRLIGYGAVPESLVKPLAGGLQEIKGIVRQLDSYVSQQSGADLSGRILQLRDTEADTGLLKELGTIIERHGLIEFRAPLAQVVEKMENPAYEIAFFGRVSSGKSSLLNRMIGVDLLPTGVTPVTSVPTRIKSGPEPKLLAWTADGKQEEYSVDRLPDFVTEARNPGNEKRITRLVVEIPLPMLPGEVVLVDTPGLGSLALEGAAETLAYLPRCDLGVVLVEASSNLHTDDVGTVDALRAASVPALIVLSKVDLVPEEDRKTLLDYVRRQLAHQLGTEIDVAPLSSRPELKALLRKWVADQIAPRVADAQRLSRESNHRKVRSLAERVLHALETSAKIGAARGPRISAELKGAEAQLRTAASTIEGTRDRCFRATDQIRESGRWMPSQLAEAAISLWQTDPHGPTLDAAWIAKQVNRHAQTEAEQIANWIQSAAGQMTAALDASARVLSTGGREERFGLQSFVKEMPAADFACPAVELRRPGRLAVSVALARRAVQHQVEDHVGEALNEFFNSYGRTLELWLRTTIDSLAREFETHADIYRAQLQRVIAGGASHDALPSEALLESASSLRKHLQAEEIPEEAVSGGPA